MAEIDLWRMELIAVFYNTFRVINLISIMNKPHIGSDAVCKVPCTVALECRLHDYCVHRDQGRDEDALM